jgi:hypothetical protein
MITRREWLGLTLGAGAALTLNPSLLQRALARAAGAPDPADPVHGRALPLVGLGSRPPSPRWPAARTTRRCARCSAPWSSSGGTVFDTAPGYGASEEVAGEIAHELGITDRIFWATKVNVARRGGARTRPRPAPRSRTRSGSSTRRSST